MKLVNKNTVTHIVAFNQVEGIWSSWGYWQKMLFVPYRKHKWWEFDSETKAGWYEDGNTSDRYISDKKLEENSYKWFIQDDSIWTRPFIQIFCGDSLVHKKYFRTFTELEKHLEDNYDNVNIRYVD